MKKLTIAGLCVASYVAAAECRMPVKDGTSRPCTKEESAAQPVDVTCRYGDCITSRPLHVVISPPIKAAWDHAIPIGDGFKLRLVGSPDSGPFLVALEAPKDAQADMAMVSVFYIADLDIGVKATLHKESALPIIPDMMVAAFGMRKYGMNLQPHNARDFLKDAYEEAMDLVVYLRGVLYERDGK